jgi:hypothetical protein
VRELDVELAFEGPDLLADRGLADVAAFRRPMEVQLLGDGDEALEAESVHDTQPPSEKASLSTDRK